MSRSRRQNERAVQAIAATWEDAVTGWVDEWGVPVDQFQLAVDRARFGVADVIQRAMDKGRTDPGGVELLVDTRPPGLSPEAWQALLDLTTEYLCNMMDAQE